MEKTKEKIEEDQMNELLTLIVQTSPIPSHPSTALLEALFRSFTKVKGLLGSRILIVCDGCEKTTDDHEVENMKHGKVKSSTASRYNDFRKRLKDQVGERKSPFVPKMNGSIEVIELSERHGSARAIETVFNNLVESPFVMIAQHDNFFVSDVDFCAVLEEMKKCQWVKAIHFHATATLNYAQKVKRRYNIEIEEKQMGQFCLIPLVFWYGRTHIARYDYYRDFVLRRNLKVGDHLEELLGETELREIKENGMKRHEKYGNFVVNNSGKKEVLYHLSGRRARAIEDTKSNSDARQQENHPQDETHKINTSTVSAEKDENIPKEVIGESFTTARSCRAVVPGLWIPPSSSEKTGNLKNPPKGKFKQKCFHCGVKGHSKNFCPQLQTETSSTQIIDL